MLWLVATSAKIPSAPALASSIRMLSKGRNDRSTTDSELGLEFFYLNQYLVLFGHIPIMLEFFWSTFNPNKTKVSTLLLEIPGPEARRKDILPDVTIHPPLVFEWPLIF
jgi:hypothetical protein